MYNKYICFTPYIYLIMFVFSLLTVSGIPSESPNTGLVIGIAVGCVAAVVLLMTVTTVIIIFVCYKKSYHKNQQHQPVEVRTVYYTILSYRAVR